MYRLSEIFYSLQDEGFWTGTPAIFIRFSGCNLKCSFCDTDHQQRFSEDEAGIYERIKDFTCKRIILTGGEPALQLTQDFINFFKGKGYLIHLETNGTIVIPFAGINWLTVSPKQGWIQKCGNELKVVYQGQELSQYQGTFDHYFLQPCSMGNIPETILKIKEDNKWRLSLQTQKILKIA
jgi:organic radical activating enzyme